MSTRLQSCRLFLTSRPLMASSRILYGYSLRNSSGDAHDTTRPSCRNATRVHNSASSMYGVETNTVMPSLFSRYSICQNSRRETGSTPVVGSSRKNSRGLCISPAARASFCFMPPDRFSARRSANGSRLVKERISRARLLISVGSAPYIEPIIRIFSITVRSR